MVKAKVIAAALALALLPACSGGFCFKWQKHVMDGSRTGVKCPSADNVPQTLGVIEDGVYTSPNGRSFDSGSTPAVAEALIGVQPEMARLKEVIAYAPKDLVRRGPECELFDFIVDRLAADVAKVTGRRVDFAFTNTGGIRVDIPAGDVLLDDLVSMLPFKNYLTWLELKGSDIRAALEYMAENKPQCISGGRVVIRDGKLVSAEIGGEPLDDGRWYGVATIDFLLDGGDGYKLARGARDYVITDVLIGDAVLADVRALTASGKNLEYSTDGRMTVEE